MATPSGSHLSLSPDVERGKVVRDSQNVSSSATGTRPTGNVGHTNWPTIAANREARLLHNIPASGVFQFVNRHEELGQIMEAIRPDSPIQFINIYGRRGVGCSALAREVASLCARDLAKQGSGFDGIIWLCDNPKLSPGEHWLPESSSDAWDLNEIRWTIGNVLRSRLTNCSHVREIVSDICKILADGRYLLVFNDFDRTHRGVDGNLGEFLHSLSPFTKVLMTSHHCLDGRPWMLQKSLCVHLRRFGLEDAIEMLRMEAKSVKVRVVLDATDEELRPLVKAAKGLPIALHWAIGQLHDSGGSLKSIVERFYQEPRTPLVEFCLQESLQNLAPAERTLLFVFSMYPEPLPISLVGELSSLANDEMKMVIQRLVRLNLICQDEAIGLCTLKQPLVRRYIHTDRGRHSMSIHLKEIMRKGATLVLRLAEEYLQVGKNEGDADARVMDQQFPFPIRNIVCAVGHAVRLQDWQLVLDICAAVKDFLYERGHWNEALKLGHWAYQAACQLKDHQQKAYCLLNPMGRICFHQGKLDKAEAYFERSLGLFGVLRDNFGGVSATRWLGRVMQAKNDWKMAAKLYEYGLAIAQRLPRDVPTSWILLGHMHAALAGLFEQQHEYEKAKNEYTLALELYLKSKHLPGIGSTLHRLACTELSLGHGDTAEDLLSKSVEIVQKSGTVLQKAKLKLSRALFSERKGQLHDAEWLANESYQEMSNFEATEWLPEAMEVLERVRVAARRSQDALQEIRRDG